MARMLMEYFLIGGMANITIQFVIGMFIMLIEKERNLRAEFIDLSFADVPEFAVKHPWYLPVAIVNLFVFWPLGILVSIFLLYMQLRIWKKEDALAE